MPRVTVIILPQAPVALCYYSSTAAAGASYRPRARSELRQLHAQERLETKADLGLRAFMNDPWPHALFMHFAFEVVLSAWHRAGRLKLCDG